MTEKTVLGEIHLPNGKKVPVIGESDRFWICKNSQFLKSKWELHQPEEKPEKKTDKKEGKKK